MRPLKILILVILAVTIFSLFRLKVPTVSFVEQKNKESLPNTSFSDSQSSAQNNGSMAQPGITTKPNIDLEQLRKEAQDESYQCYAHWGKIKQEWSNIPNNMTQETFTSNLVGLLKDKEECTFLKIGLYRQELFKVFKGLWKEGKFKESAEIGKLTKEEIPESLKYKIFKELLDSVSSEQLDSTLRKEIENTIFDYMDKSTQYPITFLELTVQINLLLKWAEVSPKMKPYASEINELKALLKQFQEKISKLFDEFPKNTEYWTDSKDTQKASQIHLFEMEQTEMLHSKLRNFIEKIKKQAF